jgi:peptide/nickel transport system permease protein
VIGYVMRRLTFAVVLVFTVSSASLILARLAPGDFVTMSLPLGTSADVIAQARARYGLGRSIGAQYRDWLARAARLDFGQSLQYGAPVSDLVSEAAANTAILAVTALAAATLVGIPFGIVSGSRRSGLAVAAIRSGSILALSLPPLLTSLVLLVTAAQTGWFPVGGMRSAGVVASSAADLLWHLALPAAALAVPIAAMFERLQSQAMSDVIGQPYVVAALGRGVPRGRVVWRDALKAAIRPVVSVYGLVIGTLLSGSFAVETVTSWPGLGQLMITALRQRDLYLVAGCAAAGSLFLAIGTLISDLALALVDPRAVEA